MFKSFLRNQNVRRIFVAGALFLAGSLICGQLFGPRMFPRLMNGIAIAVGCAVLVVYSSVIMRALKTEIPDRVQLLALGIGATWLGFIAFRVWFSLTLAASEPQTPFNSDWVSFFLLMFTLGGVQHIAASGRLNTSLPTIKSRVIAIAIVAGAVAFGFVMGAQA